MLLFVLHKLWSIIDDSGSVVSSVVSSRPALLSFHMLARNLDRVRCRGAVCPHGRRRGRHPGAEGRWDAMRVLSSMAVCPCNGRRVSLRYLPAAARYMTERLVLAVVRCFCITQKQKRVADAMIEAGTTG